MQNNDAALAQVFKKTTHAKSNLLMWSELELIPEHIRKHPNFEITEGEEKIKIRNEYQTIVEAFIYVDTRLRGHDGVFLKGTGRTPPQAHTTANVLDAWFEINNNPQPKRIPPKQVISG